MSSEAKAPEFAFPRAREWYFRWVVRPIEAAWCSIDNLAWASVLGPCRRWAGRGDPHAESVEGAGDAEIVRLRAGIQAAYDYLLYHDDRERALSMLAAAGVDESDVFDGQWNLIDDEDHA